MPSRPMRAAPSNATGPQHGASVRLAGACSRPASKPRAGAARAPLRFVPVAEAFLHRARRRAAGTSCRSGCLRPIPTTSASRRVDCSRAVAAGLSRGRSPRPSTRSLDEFATLVADDPRRRGKLTRERERELIARWRERARAARSTSERRDRHEDAGRHHRRRPGRPAARRAARQGRRRHRHPRAALGRLRARPHPRRRARAGARSICSTRPASARACTREGLRARRHRALLRRRAPPHRSPRPDRRQARSSSTARPRSRAT